MSKKNTYGIISFIGLGLFLTWWVYPIPIPLVYNFVVSMTFLIGLGIIFIFGSLYAREIQKIQNIDSVAQEKHN